MTTQIVRRVVLGLGIAAMAAADAPPVDRNVGQRMPNFTLKSNTGETIRLYAYAAQKKKAVVLVFTGTACPVSDVYAPRLAELARKYEPEGVVFLAINSNAHESAEDAAKHARELGITFPVLKDPKGLVADLALARRPPRSSSSTAAPRSATAGRSTTSTWSASASPTPRRTTWPTPSTRSSPASRSRSPRRGLRLPDRARGDQGRHAERRPRPAAEGRDRVGSGGDREEGGTGRGRQGHVRRGRRGDPPGQVPVVPPARPVGPVLAPELRRRPAKARRDDPRGRRRAPDAPLARRPAVRPLRQRPEPQPPSSGPRCSPGSSRARRWATRQGARRRRSFADGWSIGTPDVVIEMPEALHRARPGRGRLRLHPRADRTSRKTAGSRPPRPGPATARSSTTSSSTSTITKRQAPAGRRATSCGYAPGRHALGLPAGDRQEDPRRVRHPASRSTTRPTARSAPTARRSA